MRRGVEQLPNLPHTAAPCEWGRLGTCPTPLIKVIQDAGIMLSVGQVLNLPHDGFRTARRRNLWSRTLPADTGTASA